MSTSERDIPKKIPTQAVQVCQWEGPSCITDSYRLPVAWEVQQAHPSKMSFSDPDLLGQLQQLTGHSDVWRVIQWVKAG